MREKILTKGFITIATGKEQYYKIARNLLRSYRYTTESPLPFAILCEEENEYTKEFDVVRVYPKATRSYLDKVEMFELLPFDINIFIDADCLCFRDINRLFDIFSEADDFCCYGRVLPLDDKTGWFEYDNLNADLQKQIDYLKSTYDAQVEILPMKRMDISSTDIREKIKTGKSVRYLLPDSVREFIEKNHIYQ